jgi:hypothetical protein
MRGVRVTKARLYSEERVSNGTQERIGRTAKKHRETEREK